VLDREQAQELLRAYAHDAGEDALGMERAQAHHVRHLLEPRLLQAIAGKVADSPLDALDLGARRINCQHAPSPVTIDPSF
jgi:hypothetical protein